jgi:hypothetical protein
MGTLGALVGFAIGLTVVLGFFQSLSLEELFPGSELAPVIGFGVIVLGSSLLLRALGATWPRALGAGLICHLLAILLVIAAAAIGFPANTIIPALVLFFASGSTLSILFVARTSAWPILAVGILGVALTLLLDFAIPDAEPVRRFWPYGLPVLVAVIWSLQAGLGARTSGRVALN